MPNQSLPRRIDYPTASMATGDLWTYLTRFAQSQNEIPPFSFTSYSGGPNSNQTGNPGDICSNIVASAQTARLYVKELGSGTTGWVSFATLGGFTSIASYGRGTLSTGVANVAWSGVTTNSIILVTGQDGSANIGALWVTARTNGSNFTVSSTNLLDAQTFGWMAIQP